MASTTGTTRSRSLKRSSPNSTDLVTNVLYYGDNLDILRRYLPDAAVDLVYLDPPFNSNRDDNVIFRDESGNATDAQLLAFEDTWHWVHRPRRPPGSHRHDYPWDVTVSTAGPSSEYMVRVGHLNFHVVEWGDPRNAPVLLLHGRSANAMDWQRLGTRLADSYRVVAFDQRGHGLSDRPGRYTQRLLTGDVEGVVDAIGLRTFALIGHSMGGGIAWSVAARRPDSLRCLVLLEASPEPPGVHEPDGPMPQTPSGLTAPDQIVAWASVQGWTKRIGPQDLGRWLTRYARPLPGGYVAAYDESGYDRAYVSGDMWPGNRTEWRAISRIMCPSLVVIGDRGAVGMELGALLARRLRHGALAVIPRAGHAVHLENLPATLAAVRPFLDAHEPAA